MGNAKSESLGDLLERRLTEKALQRRLTMSPALAYGRHRGPTPPTSRQAAVAIAIYQDELGHWTIPLTLRPTTLQHHGGQVCLPGGRVERGEQIQEAAVREFEEELGTRASIIKHCGELSTQYVYASNNMVHPVIFILEDLHQPLSPDPVEVAEVIPLPLKVLTDPSRRIELIKSRVVRSGTNQVGLMRFRAPAFRHAGYDIWGATAMILEELAQLLHPEDLA